MENTKKLSVEDFKRSAKSFKSKSLENISGGILGACHATVIDYTYYNGTQSTTICYYTSN